MSKVVEPRIQFASEVVIPKVQEEIGAVLDEPVICPSCTATRELTFQARGRDAFISCSCGHEWTDGYVTAIAVRQMTHLAYTGQPVFFPAGRMRVVVFPDFEDDLTLAPEPKKDRDDPADHDRFRWEVGCFTTHHAKMMFTMCLRTARHLTSFAMASDGNLFARLHPAADGVALDAHMSTVLVALGLYDAAQRADVAKLHDVRLSDVSALLAPERVLALADLRPPLLLPSGHPCHLRLSDVTRMQTASAPEWDRWRQAAVDILERNIEDAVARKYRPVPAREVRADPLADWFDDDLTWYTGELPSV
ncbi:hypothetical protein ACH427_21410 [Streptomyces sp. NPDC020379]|uniref:hypothetical protein n=1 Tax=Streptomyces sp. NPDC020379 TaxID=3365071 RepID=UPI00379CF78E